MECFLFRILPYGSHEMTWGIVGGRRLGGAKVKVFVERIVIMSIRQRFWRCTQIASKCTVLRLAAVRHRPEIDIHSM